ncbi:hypothetical protein, partial [Pedobacter suwonensis]|uniref:hypothetical protein n=1 Tax=Pedobacter suwonensis TaxID=332999 RepID=UPI003D01A37D
YLKLLSKPPERVGKEWPFNTLSLSSMVLCTKNNYRNNRQKIQFSSTTIHHRFESLFNGS